jgi:hypothetical protein
MEAEKDAASAGGSVDAVVEKYVKAVGGKEALSKVESRSFKADLVLAGSTSDWTLVAKAKAEMAASRMDRVMECTRTLSGRSFKDRPERGPRSRRTG